MPRSNQRSRELRGGKRRRRRGLTNFPKDFPPDWPTRPGGNSIALNLFGSFFSFLSGPFLFDYNATKFEFIQMLLANGLLGPYGPPF